MRVADLFIEGAITSGGSGSASRTYRYRLLVAEGPGPHPLVLFLHGAGERGDDNRVQLAYLPEILARPDTRKRFPAHVLAPQCPEGRSWSKRTWALENPPILPDALPAMVEKVAGKYAVDRSRFYVTGLSMGGFGAWELAARFPELWAAVVPICGGGNPLDAPKLKDIPIWAFHGAEDDIVAPGRSREMIAAIRAAGGKPLYSELEGIGHDSWTPAYESEELLEWIFSQRSKRP